MRLLVVVLLAISLTGCGTAERPEASAPTTVAADDPRPRIVSTVANGLDTPWGLAFLPDGSAVVTERDSRRVLLVREGRQPRELGTIEQAAPRGEGGLLGVAVSPSFSDDQQLFFYLTTTTDNRILSATLRGERLTDLDTILEGIPAGTIHDGGRLAFGPDGLLYVATGDAGDPDGAQDPSNLGGKILRIGPDGHSSVVSLGHRNVQGLAFDADGHLWASEFGWHTQDELNLIEPGGNYGWPLREGTTGRDRKVFIDPQLTWPVDEASPSGLAFAAGHLWMAALRGERLWRITVSEGKATAPLPFFVGDLGRLRTVAAAPDGRLWLTTSNRDGRGDPREGDDRILIVTLR